MRKLAPKEISALKVRAAIDRELASTRDLVPPDPIISLSAGREAALATLVEAQLKDGHEPA